MKCSDCTYTQPGWVFRLKMCDSCKRELDERIKRILSEERDISTLPVKGV